MFKSSAFMNRPAESFLRGYLIWAAACVVVGWGLSLFHALTMAGYAVALPLVALALSCLFKNDGVPAPARRGLAQILSRRFRRPLPFVFLLASVLMFLGGVMYAPNNFDALTYRLPRMLNWLAHEGWTWIITYNARMNFSGSGWEWLALPLLALTRSDRGLFLISVMGFLLMPGLLFSIFRQLGVARRAAWAWMWILPLAYGYAMQGGSVGNDLTGTIFCLVAVHFGLRARRSGRVTDVWLAGLAAAVMTGIKTSNLPLLLPCLIAVWPALPCLRQRWVTGTVVVGIGCLVSALPLMVLNQKYAGNWTGDPQNRAQAQANSAGGALLGNGLLLAQQSLMPPVLPAAHEADAWFNDHLPAAWKLELAEKFPRYALSHLNELPQEESSGLGLGITLLLLICAGVGVIRMNRLKNSPPRPASWAAWFIGLAGWVAALVYGCKMGSEATARLLLPYYPLMILPFLLLPGQGWLAGRRGWRLLAMLVAASILPGLILTPSRPLWPAQTASDRLLRRSPESLLGKRLVTVYSSYRCRNDLLAPLRAGLPANATVVGFVAGSNDTDYSLWRPLGRRRVVSLRDSNGDLTSIPPDLGWIVVKRTIWPEVSKLSLEDWALQHHAEIVSSAAIVSLASAGAETWCLLQVRQP